MVVAHAIRLPDPLQKEFLMNERETEATKAGLKDLALLKLHGDDVPLDTVMVDLRKRFGNHPAAFEIVDARKMTREEYEVAQGQYLATAQREGFLRTQQAATDAVYRKYQ